MKRARRKILERSHGPEACQARIERVCTYGDAEAHELGRRSQVKDADTMVELMVPVCRPCHDWIGRHPQEAWTAGLALWGFEALDPEAQRSAWLRRLDRDMRRRPR